MVVPILENQAIAELFVIREMLEGTVAALAAKYATDEEISILKDMVEEDMTRVDDANMLARTNKLFHDTINHIAHNSYLLKFYSLLNESMLLLGKNFSNQSNQSPKDDQTASRNCRSNRKKRCRFG